MTAREKLQNKWVRETIAYLVKRRDGGPKKWCWPKNRDEKATVGGRITKASACTTYRKGLKTRRSKKEKGGKPLFTNAEWTAMNTKIRRGWRTKRRDIREIRREAGLRALDAAETKRANAAIDSLSKALDLASDAAIKNPTPRVKKMPEAVREAAIDRHLRNLPNPDDIFEAMYAAPKKPQTPFEAAIAMRKAQNAAPKKKLYSPKGKKNPSLK